MLNDRVCALDRFRLFEKLAQQTETPHQQRIPNKPVNSVTSNPGVTNDRERSERTEHSEKERVESPTIAFSQNMREQPPAEAKPWGYAGIDLMNTGAAFWQNYSESLAQELEMERKSRHQQVERDVKSPLQERSNYYKNSVLFTSTAT
ncbi:hypothetical protein FQA39_LY08491 [Lamprigera yunnana]|nr:hypothetical protein FQA39_LY08491 [Lamprigera yunnana]